MRQISIWTEKWTSRISDTGRPRTHIGSLVLQRQWARRTANYGMVRNLNQLLHWTILLSRCSDRWDIQYLTMLGDQLMPELDLLDEWSGWFMQDGAPPHNAISVWHWLYDNLPDRWTGHRKPKEWASRSPDINPADFAFCGYLKSQVYQAKIRDLANLKLQTEEECHNTEATVLYRVLTRTKTASKHTLNLGVVIQNNFCEFVHK